MAKFIEDYEEKCLRCDRITSHKTGLCIDHRSKKCKRDGCEVQVSTLKSTEYCANHKPARKRRGSTGFEEWAL